MILNELEQVLINNPHIKTKLNQLIHLRDTTINLLIKHLNADLQLNLTRNEEEVLHKEKLTSTVLTVTQNIRQEQKINLFQIEDDIRRQVYFFETDSRMDLILSALERIDNVHEQYDQWVYKILGLTRDNSTFSSNLDLVLHKEKKQTNVFVCNEYFQTLHSFQKKREAHRTYANSLIELISLNLDLSEEPIQDSYYNNIKRLTQLFIDFGTGEEQVFAKLNDLITELLPRYSLFNGRSTRPSFFDKLAPGSNNTNISPMIEESSPSLR